MQTTLKTPYNAGTPYASCYISVFPACLGVFVFICIGVFILLYIGFLGTEEQEGKGTEEQVSKILLRIYRFSRGVEDKFSKISEKCEKTSSPLLKDVL